MLSVLWITLLPMRASTLEGAFISVKNALLPYYKCEYVILYNLNIFSKKTITLIKIHRALARHNKNSS